MKKLVLLGVAILVFASGCGKQNTPPVSENSAALVTPTTTSTQALPVSSPSSFTTPATSGAVNAEQIPTDQYAYTYAFDDASQEWHSVIWDITNNKVAYVAPAQTIIRAMNAANGNVAFEEQSQTTDTIKVLNVATGAIRQTHAYSEKDSLGNSTAALYFQFSRDGKYVAYYADADVSDADGKYKKQIIVQNLSDFSIYKHLDQKSSVQSETLFGWTNDGKSLVYGIDQSGVMYDGLQPFGVSHAIWQISVDTGVQISLSNHAFVDTAHYMGIDESGDANLVLTNLATGAKTVIQQSAADKVEFNGIGSANISPDGTKLVYSLDEDALFPDGGTVTNGKTYLVNIDGSNKTVEADSGNKAAYPYVFNKWIYGNTALFSNINNNNFYYGQFGQQDETELPSPS